jgi:hypothetical protein
MTIIVDWDVMPFSLIIFLLKFQRKVLPLSSDYPEEESSIFLLYIYQDTRGHDPKTVILVWTVSCLLGRGAV